MSFLNAESRVIQSFLFFLIFVFVLYGISLGLAFMYLPYSYAVNPNVQLTIFGYVWYWTFKLTEIIWYWGMVLIITFVGGVLDVFIKLIVEPAWQALIDPRFYYAGVEFQTTLTLIRETVTTIFQPIQQLGEELQVVTIVALKGLLGG